MARRGDNDGRRVYQALAGASRSWSKGLSQTREFSELLAALKKPRPPRHASGVTSVLLIVGPKTTMIDFQVILRNTYMRASALPRLAANELL
jgi:hypothetical protein